MMSEQEDVKHSASMCPCVASGDENEVGDISIQGGGVVVRSKKTMSGGGGGGGKKGWRC